MKVAIVLRSTEHQPVSTTIVSYMACVSGLVSGEHVLDAVVAVAFVQPLGVVVELFCCCCLCCLLLVLLINCSVVLLLVAEQSGSCCFY